MKALRSLRMAMSTMLSSSIGHRPFIELVVNKAAGDLMHSPFQLVRLALDHVVRRVTVDLFALARVPQPCLAPLEEVQGQRRRLEVVTSLVKNLHRRLVCNRIGRDGVNGLVVLD